ncbi:hypothetical protein FM106_05185 [Brachybacterium faecium]|nr:hypothetical protein FM106_05185 [Brachybacterium faecium]
MTTPLRTAWGLPVDPADPHGVGPEAAARAVLPPELSAAFDGARDRIAVPRLAADGTPPSLPAAVREAMLAPALAAAEEPWPVPLLSQYARFWREGVRTDHEERVRRLGTMTGEAVLAAVATGESGWLDRAADGMLLLCELSTWCWVAHEEAHRRRGWVLPDPEAPVVDLGAAQVVEVLAWADLALGDALDARVPGLRHRTRHEVLRRVVDPVLERRDWHWLVRPQVNNWTGWIHQHLIAGALLLLDDEEQRPTRDAMLALAIAQQDRYLASFPADGGIDEGFNYFWNGACRMLEAIDLLAVASGGLLRGEDAAAVPVMAELLRYPHRMELGEGWYVNVADGPARPGPAQPWDVLHRWGRRLGDEEVIAGALAHRGAEEAPPLWTESGLGRVLTALGDRAWCESRGGQAPLPGQSYLEEVELLVARQREGTAEGLALATKGGHNDESHNHLDVGSVMVVLDASPVLIDLGQPTYRAHTFTERRYEIWTMTSSWHTLPEIRGHEQGIGAGFRARDLVRDPAGTGLEMELADAYPAEAGLESWHRRVVLDRDAEEVRIEDTWTLAEAPPSEAAPEVLLHHVLAGEVREHRAGLLRLRALSGALAEIRWDPALGAGQLETRAVEDPLLSASWGEEVHRLSLPGPASGRATVRLRRQPPG